MLLIIILRLFNVIWEKIILKLSHFQNNFNFFLVVIAAAIPNLGPFISLVGAVCLSTLGMIFPSIIELATYWETEGLGRCYWLLWKNILIILFGILGFVTGTWTSIEEIIMEMWNDCDLLLLQNNIGSQLMLPRSVPISTVFNATLVT